MDTAYAAVSAATGIQPSATLAPVKEMTNQIPGRVYLPSMPCANLAVPRQPGVPVFRGARVRRRAGLRRRLDLKQMEDLA
jgi:hypothetical protein